MRTKFKKIYPFTTENIAGYLPKFSKYCTNVLTVTGSGDHALNAIYLGANKITCFDINPNAKYWVMFKIAAIQSLSYQEFLYYFLWDKPFTEALFISKIADKLPITGFTFWENYFRQNKQGGYDSKIFNPKRYEKQHYLQANLYLKDETTYNKLRARLLTKEVTYQFWCCSLLDLRNKPVESFQLILCSNIADYLHELLGANFLPQYNQYLVELKERLILPNKILCAYLYDLGKKENYNDIYDTQKRNLYLSQAHLYAFISMINMELLDGVLYV